MNVDETVQLIDMKDEHKNAHHEGGAHGQGQDEDDDDEEGQQHGGVRCQQQ